MILRYTLLLGLGATLTACVPDGSSSPAAARTVSSPELPADEEPVPEVPVVNEPEPLTLAKLRTLELSGRGDDFQVLGDQVTDSRCFGSLTILSESESDGVLTIRAERPEDATLPNSGDCMVPAVSLRIVAGYGRHCQGIDIEPYQHAKFITYTLYRDERGDYVVRRALETQTFRRSCYEDVRYPDLHSMTDEVYHE